MKPYVIDKTGEEILDIISSDAKISSLEISKQLNIPEAQVAAIIKKLEKDRIILGYKARINWQRIRQHDVKALIEVKVTPERKVGFDMVAQAIYRYPEVVSVSLLSGSYDLLVQVEGNTLRDVALFVSEKLATIKGVQFTVSHFLLKKYKEDGVILVDQPDSKRLPIVP
jgi:DNA-binding Lrp family transcriptional regulator